VETFRLDLERDEQAVKLARDATHAWVGSLRPAAHLADDVALIVSELVTNAIVHARSAPVVRGTYEHSRLRLEVDDRDVAPPTIRTADRQVGGYGLRIVDRLAHTWGWIPTRDGKRVWAELRA
jgi:anti-sigma regulatory factor (Ser/Thr protein kinase)